MSNSRSKPRLFQVEDLETRRMFAADLGVTPIMVPDTETSYTEPMQSDGVTIANNFEEFLGSSEELFAVIQSGLSLADDESPMRSNGDTTLGDIVCLRLETATDAALAQLSNDIGREGFITIWNWEQT